MNVSALVAVCLFRNRLAQDAATVRQYSSVREAAVRVRVDEAAAAGGGGELRRRRLERDPRERQVCAAARELEAHVCPTGLDGRC